MNKNLLEKAKVLDQKTKTALSGPSASLMPAAMRNAWHELSALAVELGGAVCDLQAVIRDLRTELDTLKIGGAK